jgi:hypothetical protein
VQRQRSAIGENTAAVNALGQLASGRKRERERLFAQSAGRKKGGLAPFFLVRLFLTSAVRVFTTLWML